MPNVDIVAARASVRVASTRPRVSTATVPAATSASGAVPPLTVPEVSTARPESTRSKGSSHLSLVDYWLTWAAPSGVAFFILSVRRRGGMTFLGMGES